MVALAVFVFAEETQDQETAEQFFLRYGYYPTWYTPSFYGFRGYRAYPYSYGYYPSAYYNHGYRYIY